MKKHKGAALLYVIIISVIVMLFMFLVSTLMVENTKRSIYQKKRAEAYYASAAGIEIGTAAVLKARVINATQISFLEEFQNNPLRGDLVQENILVEGEQTVSIRVHAVDTNGANWSATSTGDVWVEIISKGVSQNGDKSVEYIGNIRILTTNPGVIVRNMVLD